TEDTNQRDRRARAGIERDVPDLVHRPPGEERDRGNRTARSDADSGDKTILVRAQVLDRRHEAEIDFAIVEKARANSRQVVAHLPSFRRPVERPRQRAGIEVAHCTKTNGQAMSAKRPSRSAGSNPAAWMLRRTSSSGARRRP